MLAKKHFSAQWVVPITIGICLLALFVFSGKANAITQIPTPDPIPGSYGLQATKEQDPPTASATISTPANGGTFSTSPITVNGICADGLLVQIYNNNVLVGSVMCQNGSFSLQVSLFAGINELTAILYDDLGQAGPVSRVATVTYNDTQFSAFGELITLTSSYGRRSAAAGNTLSWPLQLSGGTGPYAFSIDWGDGTPAELKSQAVGGLITISHVYKNAGIYQVNIKVTDANGVSAFLQVIAVASGKVEGTTNTPSAPNTAGATTQVLWIPAVVAILLLFPTYWLGRRSQLVSLHNRMIKERDNYNKTDKS